jgi:hypothetical protein
MLHLVSEHDKTDVILILATLELDMMFCQPRDYNQTVCQPRNAVLRIMNLENGLINQIYIPCIVKSRFGAANHRLSLTNINKRSIDVRPCLHVFCFWEIPHVRSHRDFALARDLG